MESQLVRDQFQPTQGAEGGWALNIGIGSGRLKRSLPTPCWRIYPDEATFGLAVAGEEPGHIERAAEGRYEQAVAGPECGTVFPRLCHVRRFESKPLQPQRARTFDTVSRRRLSFVVCAAVRPQLHLAKAATQGRSGGLGAALASPGTQFVARRRCGPRASAT